jgi:hypothetical protein
MHALALNMPAIPLVETIMVLLHLHPLAKVDFPPFIYITKLKKKLLFHGTCNNWRVKVRGERLASQTSLLHIYVLLQHINNVFKIKH